MTNSRQKGALGERKFRDVLREAGYEAKRGQQHSGSPDSPDVISNDGICHWEVKYCGKIDIEKALQQAKGDAKQGRIPVVAFKQVRKNTPPGKAKKWVAMLDMDDWLDVVKVLNVHNSL